MEALEKDFSDLVASEDAVETDTDQVTAEAGVEDIVQQILSANADQSVDEPTVAEEEAKTRLAENTILKEAGGIRVLNYKSYRNNKIRRISNIIIDNKSSISINKFN